MHSFVLWFLVLARVVSATSCDESVPSSGVLSAVCNDDQDDTVLIQHLLHKLVVVPSETEEITVPAVSIPTGLLLLARMPLAKLREGISPHVEVKQLEPSLDRWDRTDTVLIVCMLIVLVAFDLFCAPRAAYSMRNHVLALIFMLGASVVFCGCVLMQRGQADGRAWALGYALEWALSLDNLFLFHLLFRAFAVPQEQVVKALSIGIYGALSCRLVFFIGLRQVFKMHYAVDIIVGALLIISGFTSLSDSEDDEVQNLSTVRFFKWLFGSRLHDQYGDEGQLFTTGDAGETKITVLFLVVCVVSVVDCVFAIDSVGAKTGQINNLFLNLTSCLMAMFSLRSLFFIVKDMADYFEYVKYGICAILCIVGLDMIIGRFGFSVPLGWMCFAICFLFSSSLVASVLQVYVNKRAKLAEEVPEAGGHYKRSCSGGLGMKEEEKIARAG